MLNVVNFRTGNEYVQGHIVADDYWVSFCGKSVPASIREVWTDPRNPYRNKGNATCTDCIAEWKLGRTMGGKDVQVEQTESTGEAEE